MKCISHGCLSIQCVTTLKVRTINKNMYGLLFFFCVHMLFMVAAAGFVSVTAGLACVILLHITIYMHGCMHAYMVNEIGDPPRKFKGFAVV
mmetsp:Transcript_151405/g.264538  ORF Transcript_151405/g.264538 Transcript_151405/m.264538 type:complete len:91 (+) Transcript_151405:134-406(+)